MTTFDFGHLAKLAVSRESMAWFTFRMIPGKPMFQVTCASESNHDFFDKVLRNYRTQAQTSRGVKTVGIDVEMLAQIRDQDRKLYPKHVIRGWQHVKDANGLEVPFSEEYVTEFVRQLPDWVFDELREFCTNEANFTAERREMNAPELAKN
jgi:hypothetical protein